MRKLLLSASFFAVVVIVLSCGVRVPNKIPEKASVSYEKNLEFPITNWSFSVKDLVDRLEANLTSGLFELRKVDPVELRFATSVSFSPSTILKTYEDQIKTQFTQFGRNLSFSFTGEGLTSQLTGSFELPALPQSQQVVEINVSDVEIGNIVLVDNQTIFVPAYSQVSITSLLADLPFDEANFRTVSVSLTFNGTGGPLKLSVDGVEIALNTPIPLFLRKTSNVVLRNDGNLPVSGQLTLRLDNPKVNYFRNMDLSKVVTGGKIAFDLPETSFAIAPGESWQLKLGGRLDVSLTVPGFSGNVNQSLNVKSGSVNLGSASANSLTMSVPFNEVYFSVGNGLTVTGTLEVSGVASLDLRTQKPRATVTPALTPKAVKDYQLTVNVPKPPIFESISFTNDSGYAVVNFNGLRVINAETTFGETITGSQVRVSFKNVSLPRDLRVKLEAEITGTGSNWRTISYGAEIPPDQTIKVAQARITSDVLNGVGLDVSYPIPQTVKNVVERLVFSALAKVRWVTRGVGSDFSIRLNIESNIFGNRTINITNTDGVSRTEEISVQNNEVDLTTLDEFKLKITPSLESVITISNVDIRTGASVEVTPELESFVISSLTVKNVNYDFGQLVDFDLGSVFSGDFEFLKHFDFPIEANVKLVAPDALNPTLTLTISGTPITLSANQSQDIGDILKALIREGGRLTVLANFNVQRGTISQTDQLEFSVEASIPLRLTAPAEGVKIIDRPLPSDTLNLREVLGNIERAEIKFKRWRNTTGFGGLQLKLSKPNVWSKTFEIPTGGGTPTIALTKRDLENIASEGVNFELSAAPNATVQMNYNGEISIVPYIAVTLKVATEVSLR